METVTALQTFEHYGTVRRGASIRVSKRTAAELERAGLVARAARVQTSATAAPVTPARRPAVVADPSPAAGAPSSASPAARVSRQRTSKSSRRGALEALAEVSSS